MTTLYLFHPWIEANETGDTVASVFGQWWDGDAGGGGSSVFLARMQQEGLFVGSGGLL